jgi:hypothetical protein
MQPTRLLSLFAAFTLSAFAQTPAQQPDGFIPSDFLGAGEPKAQILLLGTFHFQDAGLDSFKPKHAVNILSPERQAELAEVLKRLAAFQPTKVAIETDAAWQAKADERYPQFLAGKFPLTDRPNEIYQVGFRLAQLAGLTKLNCIDVDGRNYPDLPATEEQERAYARARGEEHLLNDGWGARFTKLYEFDDELKTQLPLRNFFLYLNSPERLRLGHGHYLVGSFALGAGDKYFGADTLAGYWYDRNLRIFANVLKLAESPRDRIVVIIGAGHVPILRHLAQSAPQVRLVEVRDVLGAP